MSDTLKFFIPLEPVGQMRMKTAIRGGHASAYKDNKQRMREDELRDILREHAPEYPWSGYIGLSLKIIMPIPQSWSKKKKEEARLGLIRPDVTPDLSNCTKHLEDVGNGILWGDDKQIVDYLEPFGQHYGDVPGWHVMVKKIVPGGLLEMAG